MMGDVHVHGTVDLAALKRDADETRRLVYGALFACLSGTGAGVSAVTAGTIVNAARHHSRIFENSSPEWIEEFGQWLIVGHVNASPHLRLMIQDLDDVILTGRPGARP
jgi:hypothetical protein